MIREIVFDTETTGLYCEKGDRLVEIGAVELINHVPSGKIFHQYINPKRYIPKEVVKIHGLTEDFLKDYPTFDKIADKWIDFVGDAKLVAHNATFDMNFMNYELKQIGKKAFNKNRVIDTLKIAKSKFSREKCNLDALCKKFNIDNSKRTNHGALLDAQLLSEVYLKLLDENELNLPQDNNKKIKSNNRNGTLKNNKSKSVKDNKSISKKDDKIVNNYKRKEQEPEQKKEERTDNNYQYRSINNYEPICRYEEETVINNDNKERVGIKYILGMFLWIIGYIGMFWLGFRALVIEWLFIRESFWNMLNPFIHFKVLWHLLHDLDIYAVISCFGLGFLLFKWAEKDDNKAKTIKQEKIDAEQHASNKKWFIISLIIIAIMVAKVLPRISSVIKTAKHSDSSYSQTVSQKKTTIDDVIKLGCLSEEDFADYVGSSSFSWNNKELDYFINRYNEALPDCPMLDSKNVLMHLGILSIQANSSNKDEQ